MIDDKNNGQNISKIDQHKIDHFIDSIEEEIKTENWQRLWMKYGKVATCAVAVILIGSAVFGMWQRQDREDREAISARYTLVQNSIMSGDHTTALAQMKALTDIAKKDYATLAKLEYAALLREKQQIDALAEYKSIVDDKKINPVFKELAYILYVGSAIELMAPKDLNDNIDEFIKNLSEKYVGKYWNLFAKETLAMCYIKKGDNKLAKTTLEDLAKTTGITDSMADRTRMLIHSLED